MKSEEFERGTEKYLFLCKMKIEPNTSNSLEKTGCMSHGQLRIFHGSNALLLHCFLSGYLRLSGEPSGSVNNL